MTDTHWIDELVRLNACGEAVEWARTQPDYATAWATCERGDWMLWLAGRYAGPPESEGRRPLVLAACGCARLALPVWESHYPDNPSVLHCIETAERWARGEATMADLQKAGAAADAAYAAAYAAAAADAARLAMLRQCADVVRQVYPTPPEPSR